MGISIKNPEVEALARELAANTGESLTRAVENALRERLERVRNPRAGIAARLKQLADEYSALPDRDTRTADEILGYDEHGLPT